MIIAISYLHRKVIYCEMEQCFLLESTDYKKLNGRTYLIYCSHYISSKTSKAFVKSFIDSNADETIYYISLGKLIISTIIKQRTISLLCTRSHATCISKLMSSHNNRNSMITSSNGCCMPVGTNRKIRRKNI
jgi:hypothetical protein